MKLLINTFTGIGQIFLQPNALTGMLIAIAMLFSHWALAVACLLGSLIGTVFAHILKAAPQAIDQGLYGFNASLSFMAVLFTFGLVDAGSPMIWLLGCVASILSTAVMHLFVLLKKPAFTFPFILTSWLMCWGVAQFGLFGLIQSTPALPDRVDVFSGLETPFYAWAQVNFGTSIITGILLFLAIAIHTPIASALGLMAATIGTLMAYFLFDIDANLLANGIYGFSPVLVACAFAGARLSDLWLILAGSLLAVMIQYALSLTALPPYTIGFVIASWLLMPIKNKLITEQPKILAKLS